MDSGTVLLCRWRQIFRLLGNCRKKNTFFFTFFFFVFVTKIQSFVTFQTVISEVRTIQTRIWGQKTLSFSVIAVQYYCFHFVLFVWALYVIGKIKFPFSKIKIILSILSISIWIDLIETTSLLPLSFVYIVVQSQKTLWTFSIVLPRNVLWEVFQLHF